MIKANHKQSKKLVYQNGVKLYLRPRIHLTAMKKPKIVSIRNRLQKQRYTPT